MSADSERLVWLGEIAGVHGVRGWVKVHSFTEPRTNLFDYSHWLIGTAGEQRPVQVEATRVSGKHLIAKIDGVDDRDAAHELIGSGIAVRRDQLPQCDPGEYYWADLEGLEVVTRAGIRLGRVERLVATGANDVLVLEGDDNRMIPFVPGTIVHRVDIDNGRIEVDWDEDFWE